MKRIALFIPNLGVGGAQTMVSHLARGIDKSEFDIRIFVRDSETNSAIETRIKSAGIKCTFFGLDQNSNTHSKLISRICDYKTISKELKKFNPDIIHSHIEELYSFIYPLFHHHTKLVHTLHGYPDFVASTKFRALIWMLSKLDLICLVGCAKCVTQRAKDVLATPKTRMETIYNPIDLSEVVCEPRKERKTFELIHVARMHPIKNQMLLLNAFADVLKESHECHLTMVGDGPMLDDLKKRTVELSISSHVSFLGERSDVYQLLAQADVFVMSSDSECCPMTIIEAMACGLPIISTNVGGISEIVGSAGILVAPGDQRALAEAMLKSMLDYKNFQSMKELLCERVHRFDTHIITQQYEDVYRKMN